MKIRKGKEREREIRNGSPFGLLRMFFFYMNAQYCIFVRHREKQTKTRATLLFLFQKPSLLSGRLLRITQVQDDASCMQLSNCEREYRYALDTLSKRTQNDESHG